MKDVIKRNGYKGEYKTINGRRVKVDRKKRRSNMRGYYALAIIFSSLVIVILCMTCFFNYSAENVKINGLSLYTKEQILGIGGINQQGNLVRTDTDLIEKRLKKYLVYIDDVQVEKNYPSTLEINISEAKKSANILFDKKYYVLSTSDKLLECENTKRNKNIPLVKGMELKEPKAGEELRSTDPMKTKILKSILDSLDEMEFKNITEIDLSDRTDIILNYSGRIKIYIGSSVDIDYKLKYIKTIIDERLGDNYRGTLKYNGVNSGVSAIPESDDSSDNKDEKNQKNDTV